MGFVITGVRENVSALAAIADYDDMAAGHKAVVGLMPYVKEETRAATGEMRAAWHAVENAFVNEVWYAGFQEFGTVYVAPTLAVYNSADAHSEEIIKAFEEEIQNAVSKAGYNTR